MTVDPSINPIAPTSRWMAVARARESERADRLFDDPLAGPEGFAVRTMLEGNSGAYTPPDGGDSVWLVGDRITVKLTSEDTGGVYSRTCSMSC